LIEFAPPRQLNRCALALYRNFWMKNFIAAITTIIIFFAVGIFCIFRAREMQNYTVRYYERYPDEARWVPFLRYIKSPTYVAATRIVGLLTIGVALLLAFVLVWAR
jgi:hypothetical protein